MGITIPVDPRPEVVKCAVTSMSAQVPTLTDTTVRQPVDSEAVSFTADTTGRFIEGGICLLTCGFTYG